MSESATIIDYAMGIARDAVSTAASVALFVGAATTGLYHDNTVGGSEMLGLAAGGVSAATFTRNGSVADALFSGQVTISGNLIVNGTTTTINSTTVDVDDRVIRVNKSSGANDPAPTAITGISVYRGAVSSVARDHVGIFWDESASTWKFAVNTGGDDATLGAYSAVRVSAITAASAAFTANTNQIVLGTTNTTTITMASLAGSRTVTFPDANSNTVVPSSAASHQFATAISSAGVITWTQPAFSDISGTASTTQGGTGVDGHAAASGTLLIGNGSGYTLATLTGTSNQVTVTNGSGTITLSLPQSIDTAATPTFGQLTDSGLTVGRMTYAGTSGLLKDKASLTFDDTNDILTLNHNAASLPSVNVPSGTLLRIGSVDGSNATLTLDAYAANASFQGRRANNTAGSPSAVTTNDTLVQLSGSGYGATQYPGGSRAIIRALAANAWDDSNQGTTWRFLTSQTNAASAVTQFSIVGTATGATSTFASTNNVIISNTTASSTTAGALLIGTGTAATSVTFGGGNGNLGGTLTVAGLLQGAGVICTGNNAFISNGSNQTALTTGKVGMWRSGGTIGAAGDMVLQSDLAGNGSFVFRGGTTTPVTVGTITGLGSIVPGAGVLATTATDGFIYMSSSAGPPTGVPTSFTGRLALHYDATNNQIYVYNSAWKKTVALT